LPGARERKEAPRSVAKGRATDERSDASNFSGVVDSYYVDAVKQNDLLGTYANNLVTFKTNQPTHPILQRHERNN
jgi:hypothetical protein